MSACLFGCSVKPPDEAKLYEPWPADCQIRHQADTWEALVVAARPQAALDRSLFLWCRPAQEKGWSFEVAAVFREYTGETVRWGTLEGPANWLHSEAEGMFIGGPCSADRIAKAAWGELYQLECDYVPGGAKGNTSTRMLLVWHSQEGQWRILDDRYTTPRGWSMGYYSVNKTVGYSIEDAPSFEGTVPFTLHIRETESKTSSFEEAPGIDLHREGSLRKDLDTRWEAGWYYLVAPGDTLAGIAQRLAFFMSFHEKEQDALTQHLRDLNPTLPDGPLVEGAKVRVSKHPTDLAP